MNGSGCKNCPVNPCETTNYRGSTCAAQRAKLGLGDPKTNADQIRAMSDEELANLLTNYSNNGGWVTETDREICFERIMEWLKQPTK